MFNGLSETERDQFFTARIGISWPEIAEVHPDARRHAFIRLAALDVMTDVVEFFDGIYDARGKGLIIGYWQPWMATTPLPFPFACFPGEEENERCTRIENAIQAEEARRIGALVNAGHNLWYAGSVDYRGQDVFPALEDQRPLYRLFNGAVMGIGANADAGVEDIPAAIAEAVQRFAQEIGPDMPVILALNGPPITAQTGGGFCEADICPSDFKGMYEQTEAALDSAIRSMTPQQFVGFGVALFEGSHFDIRDPYERFNSFALNRVGETGYNNPVLNIYRAQ